MKINKAQFRWLLAGYILVETSYMLSHFWTASLVPDAVKQLEPSLPIQSMPLQLLRLAFLLCAVSVGLVGFVGMFCLWAPARYIYLVGVFLKILAAPLLAPWMVHTGWEHLFAGLEVFLDGAILTLCILGPAKDLFVRKDESNQTLEATA